jgi:uncharacterized protein (DUF1778 family)
MKHQPTGGRSGVDVLGQRPETRALCLDRIHDVEKVAQGTGEAVVLGDGDHVALAQLIEQAVQLGPAAGRAGDLVSEDPLGTRRLKGVELAVQVLAVCADAGISDDHAALCQKPPKTAKVLSWVFVHPKPLIRSRAGSRDRNDPKRPLLICTAICRMYVKRSPAMQTAQRQARLEARIAPDVHDILKRAAEIEGRSLTDFVVAAASAAARQTIAQTEVLQLSRESAQLFASLLIEPPAPTPAMERARAHHERLIGPL